jgi:hypothetical protein
MVATTVHQDGEQGRFKLRIGAVLLVDQLIRGPVNFEFRNRSAAPARKSGA